MTREEAINYMRAYQERLKQSVSIGLDKDIEAYDMAIEALEQLTSYEQTINKLTEAISEQEPFNIDQYCKEHFVVMVDKDLWEKAEKALKEQYRGEQCQP